MHRYRIDPDASQVRIEGSSSVHPITASATGLTGWVQTGDATDAADFDGEVRIAVDRLASGNPLVDRETRRRIDARHHPEIVGTVTGAQAVGPDRLGVTGTIAFRGIARPVDGELVLTHDGDRLVLEGSQTFDVRQWELRLPRLGLLRVHPDVSVRIHVVADPE